MQLWKSQYFGFGENQIVKELFNIFEQFIHIWKLVHFLIFSIKIDEDDNWFRTMAYQAQHNFQTNGFWPTSCFQKNVSLHTRAVSIFYNYFKSTVPKVELERLKLTLKVLLRSWLANIQIGINKDFQKRYSDYLI